MSEIIKTEAVVLSKMNYGDTSSIASLYTKNFGKISAIIRGGRSPKSKMGLLIDPINLLEVILYQKESRDLQYVSSASMLHHFPQIKEDIKKLKYSYAVLELLKKLTADSEKNEKLFRGVERIFMLLNSSNEPVELLFGRFFLFFLKEIGYEFRIEECTSCGKTSLKNSQLSYNYELGILCGDCRKDHIESFLISAELFTYLVCLKSNKRVEKYSIFTAERVLVLLEKFLMHHIPDFKGIQSFHLFN